MTPKMTTCRHTPRPVLHACSRVCYTCRHNERQEDPQSRHTDTHAHQDNTAPSAQPLSVTHGTSPTPQTQTQPLTQRPGGPPIHPRNPKCSEIRPPFGSECHTPRKEQSKAFCLLRRAGRQPAPPTRNCGHSESQRHTTHSVWRHAQVTSDVHGQAGRTSSTKRWTHTSPVRPVLLGG